MALTQERAARVFNTNIAAAQRGDAQAYFELGVAYSTGTDGVDIDLIEAHKWFNLASLGGVREGGVLRSEIASEMAREEVAQAQRLARAWIAALAQPAAVMRRAA